MKSFYKKLFPATIVSTLHSFWWFSLFFFISNTLFATDYNITVTASGSSNYIFNSSGLGFTDENDPDIAVEVGDKLIFDATSNTLGTHPFAIVSALTSSGGYASSNLVSGVTNNGQNGVTITWDLTGVTPGEYFYICKNHPNMVGKITVSAVTSDVNFIADGSFEEYTPTDEQQATLLPDWFSWNEATPDLNKQGGYETSWFSFQTPVDLSLIHI